MKVQRHCQFEVLERRALLSGLTPDLAFAVGGQSLTDVFGKSDNASAVVVQSDGKILAAGSALTNDDSRNWNGVLVRLNADGSPDTSFGSNGVVIADALDNVRSMTLTSTGQILLGGERWLDHAVGNTATVALYNADGTLDTSFGTEGSTNVDTGSWNDSFTRIAIAPSGKIVGLSLASDDAFGQDQSDFGVVRFNANGTIDTTFGGDGIVKVDFSDAPSIDIANAVAFNADGTMVIGGSTSDFAGDGLNPRDGGFALVRLNDDGSVDNSFGDAGLVYTPFADGDAGDWVTNGNGAVQQLFVTANGGLVAVGRSSLGEITVAHYIADGTLDTSWGEAGVRQHVLNDFGPLPGTPGLQSRWSVSLAGDGSLTFAGGGTSAVVGVLDAAGDLVSLDTAKITEPGTQPANDAAFDAEGNLILVGSGSNAERPLFDNLAWINTLDVLVSHYNFGGPPDAPLPPPPIDTVYPDAGPNDPPANTAAPDVVTSDAPTDTPATDAIANASPSDAAEVLAASAPDNVNVTIAGRSTIKSGKAYKFKAVYTSDDAIDQAAAVGIAVRKPDGSLVDAEVLRVKSNKSGERLTVTYAFTAADGQFGSEDNGRYTLIDKTDDAFELSAVVPSRGGPTFPGGPDAVGSFAINCAVTSRSGFVRINERPEGAGTDLRIL